MTVCWCLQTQQAMDNVGVPGLLRAYEAEGANHLEQGNHRNVREAFQHIFDLPYDQLRTLPRR
ncbi:hypothetical protein HRbin20_00629 [bacterium HR20]|nr:hypothetical protein HRbin20_00629 [bacterium HR20]